MPPAPNSRLDLRWTPANFAALAAACVLAGGGLLAAGAAGRVELGNSPAASPQATTGLHQRVNPNTASAASLRRLPELGPARIQQILDYRQEHGGAPFREPNDLLRVKGIGPATLQTIREYLDFAPGGG
jgi:competence protein ComEA